MAISVEQSESYFECRCCATQFRHLPTAREGTRNSGSTKVFPEETDFGDTQRYKRKRLWQKTTNHRPEWRRKEATKTFPTKADYLYQANEALFQRKLKELGLTQEELLYRAQRRVDLMQHNQRKYHNDTTEDGTLQIPEYLFWCLVTRPASAWEEKWNRVMVGRDLVIHLSEELIRVPAQLIVDLLS
jgi:hypothetical protein